MNPYTHFPFEPDRAVPPGETLLKMMEYAGWSLRKVADWLNVPPDILQEIVDGFHPVTPEIANRLKLVTGVSARRWLNLEKNYRRRLARMEQTNGLSA